MADRCDPENAQAAARLKRIEAVFYTTGTNGRAPVRDWLKREIQPEDRRAIGVDIAIVEFDWPVGMPTCKALGDGLWEVRTQISSGRTARVIFSIEDSKMILLHGFIKKTARTPKSDLDLARKRQKG